ncbi:ABC transporter ATP-binding protein [Rhizobium paknamense]|uniref:Lactose/L-arabinose transport system ATP-binding protein n=1 Tax=Rhizobium paknamense TaxID=1206817 RepID=A0ABU0IHN2_9HYPH|nr:sn-glycerol-3-phosphate ABC transporter ATP-binding protein UgpC [Rhizobium paknamense]MDQ0457768.1 lactose/L-arabinose transport system ATP-binding protein [Rhizobium paknamense]
MADVSLTDIRKSYGAVEVIKGVDLSIQTGEFVVFVGPSGCGKSTLLRMIAGLEDISSGSLKIGGAEMNDVDPSKRGIAMVFQSYALYPHMTVRENMGFALRFAGMDKTEIDRRVNAAAASLKLDALMDRKPGALSGGQRQRVAIGRAIVREPQVFLFDEPLSNLDAELRVHMRLEIAQLHKQLKTTVIYVTHDQVEAMTLADKIVVLRAGVVEQVGSPMTLYDDPDNMFVAGFIGSPKMNFLPARVASRDADGVRIIIDGAEGAAITLPVKAEGVKIGDAVKLGIRPEHINTAGTGDASLNVSVIAAENLGSTAFVYAQVNGAEIVAEQRDRRKIASGDRLALGFEAARSLLFDDRGLRIR